MTDHGVLLTTVARWKISIDQAISCGPFLGSLQARDAVMVVILMSDSPKAIVAPAPYVAAILSTLMPGCGRRHCSVGQYFLTETCYDTVGVYSRSLENDEMAKF